jgi:hypothetical protein
MSIFVGEVYPQGIVFAADKNLTYPFVDSTGTAVGSAQDLGSKVIRWPKSKALLGYVGCAVVGNKSMYDWLHDFMGDHIGFHDPSSVAHDLRDRLFRELGGTTDATIVQFAAFASRDGYIVPEFWHVTNVPGLKADGSGYLPALENFVSSERLLGVHLPEEGVTAPAQVRQHLRKRAEMFAPFWFHQGLELRIFNTICEAARQAFYALQEAKLIERPNTLAEWARYVRFWILTYGAYFDAFGGPGERYVGGGADVISIPWPEEL